jgi:hypothetical protein
VPSAADATLTAASPIAFGFLGSGPGGQIDVLGIPGGNILQVPLGETLSLVGGTVNIGRPAFGLPGFVMAAGNPGTGQPGRINLVSVTAGEAKFDGRNFDASGVSQFGDVKVRAANFGGGPPVASVVDGSEVFIIGRDLLVDNSLVFPGLFSQLGLAGIPPAGLTPGEVNVQVTGNVTVSGNTPAFGFTPGIRTRAGFTSTLPPPAVGLLVPGITINAGETVSVSGQSVIRTERLAQGPGGGDIVINADRLEVRNGAVIAANNFFAGPGGALTVSVRDAVISGGGQPTGLTTQSNFHPAWPVFTTNPGLTFADGGPLTLRVTENLTVENGGNITADSFGFGRSGSVDVSARNMTLSKGTAPVGSIGARSVFAGAAGSIRVSATESITISDGFLINALNEGSGDGGSVDLSAGQSIEMSGLISTSGEATGVFASTVPPPENQLDAFAVRVGAVAPFPVSNFDDLRAGLGLPSTADFFDVLGVLNAIGITAVADLTPGDGGQISVTTPQLIMSGDSRIDSSTASDGDAGQVQADVTDLFLQDGAAIRSQSGLLNLGTGQTVVGSGSAGSVTVNASGIISIAGTSPTAGQGASTVSTGTVGPGDGGDILLQAHQVQISNGGTVVAESTSTGLAGSITINAGDRIVLNDGSISTRASISDGGNIVLNAPVLIDLLNSQIATSVESGVGAGGNINIDPQAVVLQNSSIIANAFGGPGGNIRIVAGQFIIDQTSVVTASSALGIDGLIEINAPDTNITGKLVPLPKDFLDASKLLRDRCGAQRGGTSSFSAKGRGGVPPGPDGYLPSYAMGDTGEQGGAIGSVRDGIESDEGRIPHLPMLAMAPTRCI